MHHALTIAGKVLLAVAAVAFVLFFEVFLDDVVVFIHDRAWSQSQAALAWCFAEGALLAILVSMEFPNRIVSNPPLPGVSLLIAPLAIGGLSHYFGSRSPSDCGILTFWRGLIFAFAFTLLRLMVVDHSKYF